MYINNVNSSQPSTSRMKLRNLKASVFMKNKLSSPYKIKNYIFKLGGLTFTIYHHSSYLVNVTGVKSFLQLKVAQKILERKLEQQVDSVRIDNTFFSQKNFANVDLNQVYDFMKNSDKFYVHYNIELFAGMYMQPKKEEYPTILFFRTGSYTMMGGREENILKECELFVISLIEKFDKTSGHLEQPSSMMQYPSAPRATFKHDEIPHCDMSNL